MAPQQSAIKDKEAREQISLARSLIYHGLSLGMRYPDDTLRRQLGSAALRKRLRKACALIGQEQRAVLKAGQSLLGFLKTLKTDTLESDYIRLFGHTTRAQLSVYETEYAPSGSLRALHDQGDIAGFYRAFGLELQEDAAERVDHVGMECAFMQWLCFKEAYASIHHGDEQLTVCRDAQVQFLREHLSWWMPSLARALMERYADCFYGLWGRLAHAFLTYERTQFDLPEVSEHLGLRKPEPELEQGCMACSVANA